MLHVPQIYYQQPDTRSGSVVSTTKAKALTALLENGRNYVIDVEAMAGRDFIIHEGFICLVRNGSNTLKAIERIEGTGQVNMRNSIRRELVIRIKRRGDDIVAGQQSIRNLENVLLVCAGDKEKRNFLFRMKKKYEKLISYVQGNQLNEDLEKEAEDFYNECISGLQMNAKSVAVLQSFSWAQEEAYQKYPYICHSWMMIMCIIKMIDFHR